MSLAPLMSSNRGDWTTPSCVLDRVHRIGPIGLDPCTASSNPVGAKYILTPKEDGLAWSWDVGGAGLVYVNPPYGRAIGRWCDKIVEEAAIFVPIIALLPARTDTRWWRKLVESDHVGIAFWRGRLTFGGAAHAAPFPSAIIGWNVDASAFISAFSDVATIMARIDEPRAQIAGAA